MVLFAVALILKSVRRVDSRGTPGLGGDSLFPLLFAMWSVNTQATSCVLDLFMKFKYFNTSLGAAEDLGETRHTAECEAAEKPKYSIFPLKIYLHELSPGWMCLPESHSDGLEWWIHLFFFPPNNCALKYIETKQALLCFPHQDVASVQSLWAGRASWWAHM